MFNFSRFDTLVSKLHEESRIKIVRSFLKRIHMSSIYRHKITSDLNFVVDARVVMAGFMIAYHHTSVFEQVGDLEKTVMGSSAEILELMERIAKLIFANGSFQAVSGELTQEFHSLILKYIADFMAWKIPDEIKLKNRIIHALIALEESQMHIPEDEPADSRLNVQLKLQMDRLRAKLAHIAGPSALAAYDESRVEWRSTVTRGVGGCSTSSFGTKVSNEELGHEILLDPRFQLSDNASHQTDCQVNVNIRNCFHEVWLNLSFAHQLNL
jgi:regulator of replication initiation timing